MRILRYTMLSSLCVSLMAGSAIAQQNQRSDDRQQDRQQQDDREQQNDWQQQDSRRQYQRSQDNRSDSRSRDGQYRVSPAGWIRVAADYDNDGQFDAIETMYVYDLEKARESSRQRANRDAQNMNNSNQQSNSDRWQSGNDSEGMQRMRGDSRSGQRMTQNGRTRTYEQQRQKVRGEIQNLRKQNLTGSEDQSVMAKIETDEGRTATVCLGPQKQLSRLNLSEGDKVTIEGVRGRVNDRSVLLARKVTSDGQAVNVQMSDDRKLKRVKGEVLSKRTAKFRNQDEQHVVAKVRLISGTQETVNLGPKSKVDQLDLQEGDDVALLVRPGRVNGQPAMIAEQVSANDQTVEVANNQQLTSRRNDSSQQRNANANDREQWQSRNQYARQRMSGQNNQDREQSNQERGQNSGQAALGIAVSDSEDGVQVEAIFPNSPAEQSQLREGDEIVSIDGESIDSARQVIQAIQQKSPNERLQIKARRNGQSKTIQVRLADRSQLTGSNSRTRSNR